jgi:tetratricopeptide (TPR) repeat protein
VQAPTGYKQSAEEKAIRLKRTPETESEYRDHADVLFDGGDYDGAMKDLEAAIKLEPDLSDGYNARCFFRGEANRDLDAGTADCDRAIKLSPDSEAAFDSRGLIYYRLGKFDLALKDYDQALKLRPNISTTLYMRGIVKRRLKMYRDGDADIAAAKKIDPGIAADWRKYGVTP